MTLLCAGATLINPYGWGLHEHIVRYLGSSWILDNVNEFQSPRGTLGEERGPLAMRILEKLKLKQIAEQWLDTADLGWGRPA